MNPSGTGVEWGTPSTGGGVRLPDGNIAPTTGRWGAFFGGAVDGFGMLGMHRRYFRVHGTTTSASESVTNIYADSGVAQIAELKTACGFRRDSTCMFKAKWQLTSSAGCKVKIGLSDAIDLPAGGSGQGASVVRYDVSQSGSGHLEFDGPNRFGVRFDAGASGLNEAVTEVVVRFRKYGTPSGSATVGIRKNSDGSLISLGTFTPNSFGSGEQTTTINASSNTYNMVTNDRVTVEFPSNSTDGVELDEDDTGGSHSGYTCQSFTGSTWSTETSGIGLRIKTAPSTAGNLGDTPLINANGIMVHGTIGTHTNYQVARNNAAASQTAVDSGKALANTTAHTVQFDLNSTNIVVTLDGTAFTYTTVIPGTTTPLAFWMHIESSAAAEKGLGIVYAQVVMTT
jgi:hypothetical protein